MQVGPPTAPQHQLSFVPAHPAKDQAQRLRVGNSGPIRDNRLRPRCLRITPVNLPTVSPSATHSGRRRVSSAATESRSTSRSMPPIITGGRIKVSSPQSSTIGTGAHLALSNFVEFWCSGYADFAGRAA